MPHDIKICVPYYNVIEEHTQQGIYNLLDSTEINCALLSLQGTNIANTRNILINDNKSDSKYQKLDGGFSHYLFVDADVIPTIDAIQTLLDYDLDIVSAAYKSREQEYSFVGGVFSHDMDGNFTDALKLKSDSEGLMEVDWVGGGCVLIKKEVFENTPFPWFHYPVKEITVDGNIHRKLIFEDVGFCMNVKESGYKIYIDCDTEVKHLARNYNNDIVTNQELLFNNVRDDMDKMFQLIRGMAYENKILLEKIKDK
jgi:GT2 family glycosyltransferase